MFAALRRTTLHTTTTRQFTQSARTMAPATLPKLNYALGDLAPAISEEIMTLHYTKHHQTYVNGINAATEQLQSAVQENDIKKQIQLQAAIKFNGGGHINHSLFWDNLTPVNKSKFPESGAFADAVKSDFGSLDALKKAVNTAALGIQGSGWAWLAYNSTSKRLEAVSTPNQDPLLGLTPLLGIDLWEHAFYLDYKNVKQAYLDAIWTVIDWNTVEKRFSAGQAKL